MEEGNSQRLAYFFYLTDTVWPDGFQFQLVRSFDLKSDAFVVWNLNRHIHRCVAS
jgi:hypothetical protein